MEHYTAKDLLDHLNMLTPAQQQVLVDPSTDPLIKTLIFRIDLLLKDVEANKVADGKFIVGFKAFNKDLTCRGMQYEIGKSYVHEDQITLCKSGYHFCKRLRDVFKYYSYSEGTRICAVKAWGNIQTSNDDSKCVTDHIQILREIHPNEYLEMENKGFSNSGFGNAGSLNTGNDNKGLRNSGDYNSGNDNSGSYNIGDQNVGDHNYGYRNVGSNNYGGDNVGSGNYGSFNVGSGNIGAKNIGQVNCGSFNVGSFNCGYSFMGDWNRGSGLKTVLCSLPDGGNNVMLFNKWITKEAFSKLIFPRFFFEVKLNDFENDHAHPPKQTDEYVYREAWRKALTEAKSKSSWEKERQVLLSLPGFDFKIFEEITGLTEKEIME